MVDHFEHLDKISTESIRELPEICDFGGVLGHGAKGAGSNMAPPLGCSGCTPHVTGVHVEVRQHWPALPITSKPKQNGLQAPFAKKSVAMECRVTLPHSDPPPPVGYRCVCPPPPPLRCAHHCTWIHAHNCNRTGASTSNRASRAANRGAAFSK